MHSQTQPEDDKIKALNALYERIEKVAEFHGGQSYRDTSTIGHPAAATASPVASPAPRLTVEMPSGVRVEFAPGSALGIGNHLSVKAKRIAPNDGHYSDYDFSLNNADGSWYRTQTPLSDAEIRECLIPSGPPPIW
jgi:hypothetical protein